MFNGMSKLDILSELRVEVRGDLARRVERLSWKFEIVFSALSQ